MAEILKFDHLVPFLVNGNFHESILAALSRKRIKSKVHVYLLVLRRLCRAQKQQQKSAETYHFWIKLHFQTWFVVLARSG